MRTGVRGKNFTHSSILFLILLTFLSVNTEYNTNTLLSTSCCIHTRFIGSFCFFSFFRFVISFKTKHTHREKTAVIRKREIFKGNFFQIKYSCFLSLAEWFLFIYFTPHRYAERIRSFVYLKPTRIHFQPNNKSH